MNICQIKHTFDNIYLFMINTY